MTEDTSATTGDVAFAYNRNRRRLTVQWFASLGIFLVLGTGLQIEQNQVTTNTHRIAVNTYHACLVTKAATVKSNAFYTAMTDIEAHNRFVNQAIRDRRVSLYRGMRTLPTPVCVQP